MKIAIPLTAGALSTHFGHCEEFAIVEIDAGSKEILGKTLHPAPPHEPGFLPGWLRGLGAEIIIAGGMGQRAQQLFANDNIAVLVGASAETPEKLVADYLSGTLQSGRNACDH